MNIFSGLVNFVTFSSITYMPQYSTVKRQGATF
ncbi:hypothetical protein C4J83_3897 [Pseudomonas sp. LBUM920]|nr:hypothetical protein C4J83_3897 [Pseudomonas sp. LBUM920]